MSETVGFPGPVSGNNYEMVSTPDLLALHLRTGVVVKELAVAWSMLCACFGAVLVVVGLWWTLFIVVPLAVAVPVVLWRRRHGVTVTLSSAGFSKDYPSGETLTVPIDHIVAFEAVPRVRSYNDHEPDRGGFVEVLEAPTEAVPVFTFGLLPHHDSNSNFGRGLPDAELILIATVFNQWLTACRACQ